MIGTQVRLDTGGGGYYLHNTAGTFRAAFWDNGTNTRIFADGNGSTAAIEIESNNTTFAGAVTVGPAAVGRTLHGAKSFGLSENTFTTGLTVVMASHTSCYVKVFMSGDWSNHSAVTYLGEFFLQNGGGDAYEEPGMIIRQVDNTKTDTIEAKIVDPSGSSGNRNYVIQFRANDTINANGFTAKMTYEIMGLFVSAS